MIDQNQVVVDVTGRYSADQAFAKANADMERQAELAAKVNAQLRDMAAKAQGFTPGATTRIADSFGKSQEIQQVSDRFKQLHETLNQTVPAAEKAMFATAGAKRELIVLAHEAVSGNFSQMPGSFLVLAERIHLSETSLLRIGAPLAAAALGVYELGKAYLEGSHEVIAMNNALAVTSNYAGMTRGSMRQLAESMTADGTVTIGVAKEVVTELVASGRLGSESLQGVAKLAADFAHATGRDIEKIAPTLAKVFEDPAKGAEELNKSMHFLSTEQREYIARLERTGDVEGARKVLLEELNKVIPRQAEHIGTLVAIWNSWKQSISGVADAMQGLGRPKTVIEEIGTLENKLSSMASQYGTTIGGLRKAVAGTVLAGQVDGDLDKLETLRRQARAEQEVADAAAAAAKSNERQALAQKESEKSATYQVKALRDQLTLLNGVESNDDIERRKLEINKQIEDIQRSMGAEAVAVNRIKIDGELKLQELAIKMGEAQNDSALRIRAISQEEHDRSATAFALQRNAVETIAAIRERSAANLTDQEKAQLDYRIKSLKIEAEMIAQRGEAQALEDRAAVERSKAQAGVVVGRTQVQWDKDNDAKRRRFMIQPAAEAELQADLEKVTEASERARLTIEQMHLSGKLGAEAYADALKDLAEKTEVQQQTTIALSEEQKRLNGSWEYGAARAMQRYQDQSTNVAAQTERAFSTMYSRLGDAAVGYAMTGKSSIRDLARVMLEELVRIQMQAAAAKITSGIGGWLGGLFGSGSASSSASTAGSTSTFVPDTSYTFAANGAVFSSPDLHQYANTVQSTPKVFGFDRLHKFAKGGVFAEAGPEAVMPLTRDGMGRLGVRASGGGGGGTVVNQIDVHVDAKGSSVEGNDKDATELGRRIGVAVRTVLIEEKRPGGLLAA